MHSLREMHVINVNGQALCIHSLVPFQNLLDIFQFLEIDAEDYRADFFLDLCLSSINPGNQVA